MNPSFYQLMKVLIIVAISASYSNGLIYPRRSLPMDLVGAKARLHATVGVRSISDICSWWENLMSFTPFKRNDIIKPSPLDTKSTVQAKRVPSSAVLVFGATGGTGKYIVDGLLQKGREVVVTGRNISKLQSVYQFYDDHNLHVLEKPIDVTNLQNETSETLQQLYEGVQQIAIALEPSFTDVRQTEVNAFRDVDFFGVQSIVQTFQQHSRDKNQDSDPTLHNVIDFSTQLRNLSAWRRLDDVIMGGKSESYWTEVQWNGEGDKFCRWTGNLVTKGGGFCGTTATNLQLSARGYHGIRLKVRGNGKRYKFRVKTSAPESQANECQYQAMFDTVAEAWIDVHLPFDTFVAVRRNDVVDRATKLSTALSSGTQTIASIGLVYSKFTFNERSNVLSEDGPFQLDVESIDLYEQTLPQVVLVSSAGTERINRLQSRDETKRDIPIVQLNPNGVLNWKYLGEEAVRQSGLRYCIVRSCGLVNPPSLERLLADNASIAEDPLRFASDVMLLQRRRLDFRQGDCTSGRMLRSELGAVVVAALNHGESVRKTFEVRRDETPSGRLVTDESTLPPTAECASSYVVKALDKHVNNWGLIDGELDQRDLPWPRLFRELVKDEDRAKVTGLTGTRYLPPLPFAQEPLLP